ncbi:MAG: restriction endonuclease subunit S [Prevotella bivia]|uniref:restriction endonuclease subunit S n=1 Tax=Prevotella bivia TaxID=28125 RepID=UPI0007771A5C|nr:restriction endonuclease subunit S [Prevotella bivia]KXU56849.1 type I restriction modification DNA specificity domain protein [Prevotella bivia]MDU7315088.1 restriction endonuclease subunit S [Prevotella bivia]MDZ3817524.1 restriction endonuclease subunit S [Prevotella bivia]
MKIIEELLKGEKMEWKPLGEVAELKRGKILSKTDKGKGDVPFILYGELYTTYGNYINDIVSFTSDDRVKKVPKSQKGDLLLPISSTTKEAQIGKVSVVNVDYPIYIGGDALILSHSQNPSYLMYLMNGSAFEKEKMKCVTGTTIMHLSPQKLLKILIPLPPLSVQQRIVEILDKFTELETELETELDCRKRQYEYYRNKLLSYEEMTKKGHKVMMKTLGEVCPPNRGKRLVRNQLTKEGYPVYQNSLHPLGYYHEMNCRKNMTFVISAGAAGEIGFSYVDFWAADDCYFFNCQKETLNDRFLYYFLCTQKEKLKAKVRRASIPRLGRNAIENLLIPLPPLSEQQRIVDILDKFDTLTTSISEGLPKEIELRRKQYEYYRNELLSFAAP